MQLYSEILQKFRLAARGHGEVQPPESERWRVETYFDPLPIWYPPFEEAAVDDREFALHAVTQRPMHMYHSWGSQNAWLRQITARNRLFVHPETAGRYGVAEDDWVWVISHHGRVKGQVKLMHGVNPATVWTWNAIGKRRGAWGLDDDAPESNRGFLLNHIISELLPEREGGHRYSNSDPVTGQAVPLKAPPPRGLNEGRTLRYGADLKCRTPAVEGEGLRFQEWIGNRHEIALNVSGVADGRGNVKKSGSSEGGDA